MVQFLKKIFAGEERVTVSAEGRDEAATIINGVGGKDNINKVWNCFTRLRINIKDWSQVNEDIINQVANNGIIKRDNTIQIVFGMRVNEVRKAVDAQLADL